MKKQLLILGTTILASNTLGIITTNNNDIKQQATTITIQDESALIVNHNITVNEESKPVNIGLWTSVEISKIKTIIEQQLKASSEYKNILSYSIEIKDNITQALVTALAKNESTILAFNYSFIIESTKGNYQVITAQNKELRIDYLYNSLHPIQRNLNAMIPAINTWLSSQRKIFFLKDTTYPIGAFVIKQLDGSYHKIIPQDLWNYLWGIFQWSYNDTAGSSTWGWHVYSQDNMTIPDLVTSFNNNLIEAQAAFNNPEQSEFSMPYFIKVKTTYQGKTIEISSTHTFDFKVYKV